MSYMNSIGIGLAFVFSATTASANVCSRSSTIVYTLERMLAKKCSHIGPADLAAIKKIEMPKSLLTSLAAEDFDGLKNLEEVSAYRVGNRRMVDVFSKVPQLKKVHVEFNGQQVNFGDHGVKLFPELPNLEILELSHASIVDGFQEADTTEALALGERMVSPTVRRLVIRDSNVDYISFHFFEKLPLLEVADFTNNRIEFFVGGILDHSVKLRTLALSGNDLSGLDALEFPESAEDPVAVHVCNVRPEVVTHLKALARPAKRVTFVTENCL